MGCLLVVWFGGGGFFPHNYRYQIICLGVCNGAFRAPSPADQSTRQMSDCPLVSTYIIITPSELLQNSTGVNKNRIWPYIYFKLGFIGEKGWVFRKISLPSTLLSTQCQHKAA